MAWAPDVVYLLRVQLERQDVQFFPSVREYHRVYGITTTRLAEISDRGLYIMHPGPVNRGVELCDAVMDYERSLITNQVENGISVRMAVVDWLKPGGDFPKQVSYAARPRVGSRCSRPELGRACCAQVPHNRLMTLALLPNNNHTIIHTCCCFKTPASPPKIHPTYSKVMS